MGEYASVVRAFISLFDTKNFGLASTDVERFVFSVMTLTKSEKSTFVWSFRRHTPAASCLNRN